MTADIGISFLMLAVITFGLLLWDSHNRNKELARERNEYAMYTENAQTFALAMLILATTLRPYQQMRDQNRP